MPWGGVKSVDKLGCISGTLWYNIEHREQKRALYTTQNGVLRMMKAAGYFSRPEQLRVLVEGSQYLIESLEDLWDYLKDDLEHIPASKLYRLAKTISMVQGVAERVAEQSDKANLGIALRLIEPWGLCRRKYKQLQHNAVIRHAAAVV